MNNAQGHDVSQWDMAPINGAAYAASRSFCVVKVSEGTTVDPLFAAQWAGLRGHTRRSPYHFWRSFVNGKLAVQKFLELLGQDPGELPATLDLEVADGSTEVMALAKVWADEYYRLTGLRPILYSRRSFLLENGAAYQSYWDRVYKRWHNAWLADLPLMLAEWPFDEIDTMPGYAQVGDQLRTVLIREVIDGVRSLPWPKPFGPWSRVEYYQWTSRYPPESVPGYYLGAGHKKAVDAILHIDERFTFEHAHELPGGNVPPPPPPEPTPKTLSYVTLHYSDGTEEVRP